MEGYELEIKDSAAITARQSPFKYISIGVTAASNDHEGGRTRLEFCNAALLERRKSFVDGLEESSRDISRKELVQDLWLRTRGLPPEKTKTVFSLEPDEMSVRNWKCRVYHTLDELSWWCLGTNRKRHLVCSGESACLCCEGDRSLNLVRSSIQGSIQSKNLCHPSRQEDKYI